MPSRRRFTGAGVQVAVAKVATEAQRAMDSFYIPWQEAWVERASDEAALLGAIHRQRRRAGA